MNSYKLIIVSMFTALFCACSGNGQSEADRGGIDSDSVVKNEISSISEYSDTMNVKVDGKTCKCVCSFINDKSAPVITTADGYRYYDNKAKVIISGEGVNMEKEFSKKYFAEKAGESMKDYALVGFCYNHDKEDDQSAFYFIATVGDPNIATDDSKSFSVKITRDGAIQVTPLEDRDMQRVSDVKTVDPSEDAG